MRTRSLFSRVLALVLALSVAVPPLLEARYKPTTGRNFFSVEQEVQVGQQAAAETNKKMPVLPESDPITRYVQNLGRQLAAHAPGEKWPYNFHVVNQKDINAFALPGGPVYVNLGTIQAADNEAQLAGVVAHELSHVVQRHATRAASKQMMAQVPLTVLGSLLGGGMGAQLARLGISFGVGSYFLKNSREAEREADLIGADIMYDTGYDPRQMAAFFEKLEAQGGARGPQFLSDHPNPGNRAEAVGQEVRSLGAKSFRQDSPEFRQMKARAGSMKAMSAQEIQQHAREQGGSMGQPSRGDVMPSGNFRSLEHQAFTISYPDNWRAFGDQQSAVTIAPQAGVTQGAVAYGVIINDFQPENARSVDEATQQLLASLRQSNPDLRQVGRGESIRVNGVAGKSVDMIGTSPVQSSGGSARERDWLVALPSPDGSLMYLVFVAPDQDFTHLRPAFEQMLRSFRMK